MVYAEQSFYSPQRLPAHHQCGTHLFWCYRPTWLDFQLWGNRVNCGIWVVFFINYYKASVFDSSLTEFKIKRNEWYEINMEYVAKVLAIIHLCVFIAVLLTVWSSMAVGIPCAKIDLPYLRTSFHVSLISCRVVILVLTIYWLWPIALKWHFCDGNGIAGPASFCTKFYGYSCKKTKVISENTYTLLVYVFYAPVLCFDRGASQTRSNDLLEFYKS